MKINYLIIVILVSLLSCNNTKKQEMKIRYTSINDYDANYIFDFQNNKAGLKMINQYVIEDIKSSKHFADSIVNKLGKLNNIEKTKYLSENNLPTKATDVSLYIAREDLNWDPNNNNDLLIVYKLDENTFKITDFKIPYKSDKKNDITIQDTGIEKNSCILKINKDSFHIETLKLIKEKIDKLNYQKQENDFSYLVKNNNDVEMIKITFTEKGKHISLTY